MSWRRCPCKSWRGCQGYEWYSYSDICFCRLQCIWLIYHLLMLGNGVWPTEPKDTGYIEQLGYGALGVRQSAPFEAPAGIAGEVGRRLEFTGDDGGVLMHEIIILHAERYEDLSKSARNALNYIVGIKAKMSKYSDWLKKRNYRSKVDTKSGHDSIPLDKLNIKC